MFHLQKTRWIFANGEHLWILDKVVKIDNFICFSFDIVVNIGHYYNYYSVFSLTYINFI